MAKTTKKALQDAIDTLSYWQTDSHGAVGEQEKDGAVNRLRKYGLDLIKLLQTDLNAHAQKIRNTGERMIDINVKRIEWLETHPN